MANARPRVVEEIGNNAVNVEAVVVRHERIGFGSFGGFDDQCFLFHEHEA